MTTKTKLEKKTKTVPKFLPAEVMKEIQIEREATWGWLDFEVWGIGKKGLIRAYYPKTSGMKHIVDYDFDTGRLINYYS